MSEIEKVKMVVSRLIAWLRIPLHACTHFSKWTTNCCGTHKSIKNVLTHSNWAAENKKEAMLRLRHALKMLTRKKTILTDSLSCIFRNDNLWLHRGVLMSASFLLFSDTQFMCQNIWVSKILRTGTRHPANRQEKGKISMHRIRVENSLISQPANTY